MEQQNHISYVEFPTIDLNASRSFFKKVFEWNFTDYGPEYSSFSDSGIAGGFRSVSALPAASQYKILIVLYSKDLKNTKERILQAGGEITRETFSFPGGYRFHFKEPGGNELAVWSETDEADA